MTPADTLALKKAIKAFWLTKTDEQLAASLSHRHPEITPFVVREMRHSLDLKGKESLKDFARRYLLEMTDPEKKEFMSRLPAELIWRMAEGSPATTGDININTEPIRIDIRHQLLKIYGPTDGTIPAEVLAGGEAGRLSGGPGE